MIIAKIDPHILTKIPESCEECPFTYEDDWIGTLCGISFFRIYEADFDTSAQRFPNCPLIEEKEEE